MACGLRSASLVAPSGETFAVTGVFDAARGDDPSRPCPRAPNRASGVGVVHEAVEGVFLDEVTAPFDHPLVVTPGLADVYEGRNPWR